MSEANPRSTATAAVPRCKSRIARRRDAAVRGEVAGGYAAAAAVGATLAGVDLLPGPEGRLYAIEVNAVPGWKALAATLHVDVAAMVLDYLAEAAGV